MIYQGDCLDIMPKLEAGSVQCVVTSPPYYGLRDYGVNGQIGLEDTPEAFVAKLVAAFQEVRRVLRDDGTVWLNLGDSYNGSGKAGSNPEYQAKHTEFGKPSKEKSRFGMPTNIKELKPKDLIGIPWRVAFALQADGWWLRQDIIWHKPNPMPESVTDRCTKAHEYIFLLTKSAKYFYEAEAIREPQNGTAHSRGKGITPKSQPMGQGIKANNSFHAATALWHESPDSKRNRRSVWTITTKPFKGAHFATFPPELPDICIKAGTSEKGCCPECGSPWVRLVEKTGATNERARKDVGDYFPDKGGNPSGIRSLSGATYTSQRIATNFWRPTCTHNHEPVPCIVLDPFAGAGTVGVVAEKLGRAFVGIELNPEYVAMAERRINNVQPLLLAVTA
jgi:DNA modification methylase